MKKFNQLMQKLAVWTLIALGFFLLGTLHGMRLSKQHAIDVATECVDDEDCYERYGCGGYADPCEQEAK